MALVVLIADGGPDAGLGHISRCSALAAALQRGGAHVRTVSLGLQEPLYRYGIGWEPVDEPDVTGADAIVLDSYRADDELSVRLASSAPLVVFADDHGASPQASLLIRSGAAKGGECELAGADYACLGPEYWLVPPRAVKPQVERVLVTTGGGDGSGAGPGVAALLRAEFAHSQVTLVRGPYAPPADLPEGVHVASAPEGLFDLLCRADVVVSTAGQTMLEALAAGTPCVALVTAENQRAQADELQTAGALTVACSPEEVALAAGFLARDADARSRQAMAGQRAIDGQGAMRVADYVLRLTASRRGRPGVQSGFELRAADPEDAGFLLRLRNDPVTRGYSFNHDEVSEDEHFAWLEARLSDPATRIWIALYDGRSSGQLRLTRLDEHAAEVHIAVAPELRGHGLAREMLARAPGLCVRSWPEIGRLRARIMTENHVSLRAFHAAGFCRVEGSERQAERVLEREIGSSATPP